MKTQCKAGHGSAFNCALYHSESHNKPRVKSDGNREDDPRHEKKWGVSERKYWLPILWWKWRSWTLEGCETMIVCCWQPPSWNNFSFINHPIAVSFQMFFQEKRYPQSLGLSLCSCSASHFCNNSILNLIITVADVACHCSELAQDTNW